MPPARSVVRRSRTVMGAAPRAPRSKIRLWSAQRGHNCPEPSGFLAAARRAALVRAALRGLGGLELAVDVVPIGLRVVDLVEELSALVGLLDVALVELVVVLHGLLGDAIEVLLERLELPGLDLVPGHRRSFQSLRFGTLPVPIRWPASRRPTARLAWSHDRRGLDRPPAAL